jgi:putative ABC transport system permease protein
MLARSLVSAAAALAPAAERDDFRREWLAEIEWLEASGGRSGVGKERRALGAFAHALWLRKEQWRVDMLWHDVRFGIRTLAGRPAFTALAVLILALGIGANTAMFSLVYGVLLKPLPFHEPDRLVQIWETNPLRNWTDATASPANLLDWRARNRVFDGIAFYPGQGDRTPMYGNGTLTGGEHGPEPLRAVQVSTNFFQVLGVAPALGRPFDAAESEQGRHRVILLSDALWRGRFGGDPAIVGREITINAQTYQVVGVMPPAFRFPAADIQAWVPFVITPQTIQQRRPHYLRPIARLKDGVTIEQARADMTAIAAALEREYPDTNTQMGVGLGPLQTFVVGDARTPLFVFLGAVAVVLLIACANLANLLLARATSRRREFAVRAALGGAGWRLARQLLVESLLIAIAGGLAGLLLGQLALDAIVAATPGNVPRLDEVALDGRVLLVVAGMISATALLFGIAPAWHAAHADIGWVRDGTRATGSGGGMRRALVIAQIAASVALVGCAGLLLRSFERLQAVSPGFDPSHALTFRITLPAAAYGDDPAKPLAFFDRLFARVGALPGVTAVGGATVLGLQGQGWTGDLFIEGRPEVWGRELRHKEVTPGYFAAMALPIVRGRNFTHADGPDAPLVVIANEALVRTYFRDEDPVGQRITFRRAQPGATPPPVWTIVGVARDEKQNALDEEVKPGVYASIRQDSTLGLAVVVRSTTSPESLVAPVRQELRRLDGTVAMYDIQSLEDLVADTVVRQRFTAGIVTLFAALALTLAAVGVYGVVSQSVGGRVREIGVRIALGATRRDVTALVMRDTFSMVGLGLAAGLVIAVIAARAIDTLLFQTPPSDPAAYALVVASLAGASLLASYTPLRRALRIDPNAALRCE